MKKEIWHNLEDFSWGEHAFSILGKFIPEIAEAINCQSEHAFLMTRGTFGSDTVDTATFRRSIVDYLMGIHGIKDDAVAYTKINKVLHYFHKCWIKKMMCEP